MGIEHFQWPMIKRQGFLIKLDQTDEEKTYVIFNHWLILGIICKALVFLDCRGCFALFPDYPYGEFRAK